MRHSQPLKCSEKTLRFPSTLALRKGFFVVVVVAVVVYVFRISEQPLL